MLTSSEYDDDEKDNLLFEISDEKRITDKIHANFSLQSLEVSLKKSEDKANEYDEMRRQANLPEDSFVGDFRLLYSWISSKLKHLTNFLQGHDYADELVAEIYNK